MNKQDKFLTELASLLRKHDVALCAEKTSPEFAEVFFIFDQFCKEPEARFHTGRSHSTAYEIGIMRSLECRKAEQYATTNADKPFEAGELIEYDDEEYEVVKNYGSGGEVKYPNDESGELLKFHWVAYGETCKRVVL
jgi:hypothetical protein